MYNKINGIDFRYLLLDYYKELNLTNEEVLVLLMCDHLLNDSNTLISIEQLEMKLDLSFSEIDKVFNSLLTKKYIIFETVNNDFVTTLKNIKHEVLNLYKRDLLLDEKNGNELEVSDDIKTRVFSSFEHYFNRDLNETEKEMILKWIAAGIDEEIIIDSLKDAYNLRTLTIKKIDGLIAKKMKENEDF